MAPIGFILERKSLMTGKRSEMFIPMDPVEFQRREQRWASGELIQHAFPELSDDLREFVKTGITPAEWDTLPPFAARADREP